MSEAVVSVRVIALGNPMAGDDGAALEALRRLTPLAATAGLELCAAGQPGVDLLGLLEGGGPVILLDVLRGGSCPGQLHQLSLADLCQRLQGERPASSHLFGPGETLLLGQALGRPLPPGLFLGLEGAVFAPGAPLSPAVSAALPGLLTAVLSAARGLTTGSHP